MLNGDALRGLPRGISALEAAVVRRVLEVGGRKRPSFDLLLAVGRLTVVELCECGCEALYFQPPSMMGSPIASAYGFIEWGCPVELILWAREGGISFLELEPKVPGLGRLPLPDSIRELPEEFYNTSWQCRVSRNWRKYWR